MLPIYRLLLRLYPAAYCHDFAAEMASVFAELEAETTKAGPVALLRFYFRETAGVFLGAVQEHVRQFPMRRLEMKNQYRFPRTSWVLMTIILAGVMVAINKGQAISNAFASAGPGTEPIHKTSLVAGIAECFIVAYALGMLAWIIVYAMRRSGAHRLDEISAQR